MSYIRYLDDAVRDLDNVAHDFKEASDRVRACEAALEDVVDVVAARNAARNAVCRTDLNARLDYAIGDCAAARRVRDARDALAAARALEAALVDAVDKAGVRANVALAAARDAHDRAEAACAVRARDAQYNSLYKELIKESQERAAFSSD